MTELYRALEEIDAIRTQVARTTQFRGYGPATLAVTGVLAFMAAIVQTVSLKSSVQDPREFLTVWIATAIIAVLLIGLETIARTQRAHPGLEKKMMQSALEHFLPAVLAGLLLTVVLFRSAPQSLWMLPGLWQVLFSLGVFSSCAFLPRPIFAVGVWYLASGLTCLALGGAGWVFSPWAMGVPFGVGQLMVAAVLQWGYRQTAVPNDDATGE